MLDQETANFRELCLYFIQTEQWGDAYDLHQQTYGSSPADAKYAIHELAVRYGYAPVEKSASVMFFATCSLMTFALTFMYLQLVA